MEATFGVLVREKARLEKRLASGEPVPDGERTALEKQLETVNSDIGRMEQYIDRPNMQTWSELIFVDDIRQRVKRILDERGP